MGGPPVLDPAVLAAELAAEDGPRWQLLDGQLVRSVECATFPAALDFVVAVGHLAEEADHHPDIDIRWRTVRFTLSTHSAGGLTQRDLDLADEIDRLAGDGAGDD